MEILKRVLTEASEEEQRLYSSYGTMSMAKIDSFLWLGSIKAVRWNVGHDLCLRTRGQNIFKNGNIKRVLTVAVEANGKVYIPNNIIHKVVECEDDKSFPIITTFRECHEFIRQGECQSENTIVHCMAGYSRAATIIISWLMQKYSLPPITIIPLIKTRWSIGPNPGFCAQLLAFQGTGNEHRYLTTKEQVEEALFEVPPEDISELTEDGESEEEIEVAVVLS